MKRINYLDGFSGLGGFALGLKRAGFVFNKHIFSEKDKYAISNYKYNFPKATYGGTIEEITKEKVGQIDLFTFGSPCQNVSIAGNREGLRQGDKTRLFFEAVRIINEVRPSCFIFENVKGLFSSQKGADFQTVLELFANAGIHGGEWQLTDTAQFLPQERERLFFIGYLRKKNPRPILPI